MEELDDILAKLGNPSKVGANQTWVGKSYSKRDLILDLRKLREKLCDKPL